MLRILTPLFVLPFLLFSGLNSVHANCPNPNPFNLIPNGDFGTGADQTLASFPDPLINTLLTYNFGPSPSTAKYTLINSTVGSNSNWIEIGDNSTDPNGYMMLINGYPSAVTNYSFSMEVCEGLEYYIGLDVINLFQAGSSNSPDPNLELRINGVPLIPAQTIQKGAGWVTLGANYIVPAGESTLDITLYNYTGAVNGNDFAIDNVTANLCGSDVIISETTNAPYCPGDILEFTADIVPNSGNTVFYQLQTSFDGGISWTNEGSPVTLNSFTINNIPFGLSVRILANENLSLLSSPNCSYSSQSFNIPFSSPDDCFNSPISSPGLACSGALGPNIISNGNFGSGIDQFAPMMSLPSNTMIYANDGFLEEGEFTVANNWSGSPCLGNSAEICWISDIQDQSTNSNDYILIANGSSSNEIVWSNQGLGFCGDLIHTISFDVLNLASTNYAPNNPSNNNTVAQPEVEVVLSSIGESEELIKVISAPFSTGLIPNDGLWHNFSFSFLGSNFQNNLKISLRLNGAEIKGNDIAIDNISVQFCGPEITLTGPSEACENEVISILASTSNGQLNSYFYKWEKSLDAGLSWSPISGSSGAELTTNAEIGALYRVNIAYNEFNGIPSDNCFAISDPFSLNVLDTGPYPVYAKICPGEYYYIGTDSFDFDIIFTDTLTSFNGCDSIVDLTLEIEDNMPTVLTENICVGEEILWGGEILSEEGIYFDTLSSFLGCDSILYLSIIVKDSNLINQNVNLCIGEPYNGVYYNQDTTLYQTYSNIQGCDSTIATNIRVSELDDFEIYGDFIICNDLNPSTTLFVDEFYKYKWSNGSIQQTATFTMGGNYAVTVTDDLGCEADQVFNIEMIDLDMNIDITPPLCHDDTTGIIDINEVNGGSEPYLYSIDGGSTVSTNPYFQNVAPSEDSLMIFIIDDNGCIITEKVFVQNPDPLILDLGDEAEINVGESITISAESNQEIFSIDWMPIDSINCEGCLDITLNPVLPYRISATISNEVGCKATDSYDIKIGKKRNVFIPNIFSPNNDGTNDIFYIQGGIDIVEITDLIVYDRWGNMVFSNPFVIKNSPQAGWNGRFHNNFSPAGVYSYHFIVLFTDGKTRRYEGSVTLMR
jgi:gliding motility-associated-like protein